MRFALLFAVLLVAACGSRSVTMINPETGDETICGPYEIRGLQASANAILLRECVADFKDQGYIRAR